MKILLLDNYDSFTYNLLHLVEQFENVSVDVFRNDEISLSDAAKYDRIILSPGPGIPDEAGILKPLIKQFAYYKPILGVCLGMQAIAEVYGGRLMNMDKVTHGVAMQTTVTDKNEKLFKTLPSDFNTGRYHSWCVDPVYLPAEFRITATDADNRIMAITHENNLLRGIQFHPESILTEYGKQIMNNWLFEC